MAKFSFKWHGKVSKEICLFNGMAWKSMKLSYFSFFANITWNSINPVWMLNKDYKLNMLQHGMHELIKKLNFPLKCT